MPLMSPSRARRAAVAVPVVVASLAFAAPAAGHAVVSPPVAEPGALQVFTLSVPTEREERLTTEIELTVPKGFAIDSFAPARGWRRTVASTGSGETAIVNRVTWKGGAVPTGEDAVFQFNATPGAARTYEFRVRQTYDDEAVVDWAGAEGSDNPAPLVEAKALGGGGSSTIAIVALMAGTLGILLALLAILGARGERPIT